MAEVPEAQSVVPWLMGLVYWHANGLPSTLAEERAFAANMHEPGNPRRLSQG
jgi:hypothetical protein